MFDGRYNKTDKGVPQGSIIGPILSNIYLHHFDIFMKQLKETEDSGLRRKPNPIYTKILRKGKYSAKYTRKHKILPTKYNDDNFKRLIYVRYADDFIIGLDGSKEFANKILDKVSFFLTQNLKFELKEPVQITHYRTTRIKFLGVYLKGNRQDLVPTISFLGRKARSPVRPLIIMPIGEIKNKLLELKFVTKKGNVWKPTRCGRLIHHDLHRIIKYYNSIYRGLCGYYFVCMNRALLSNIHYFLKYSCALTIASKMKLKTKSKVFKKYGYNLSVTLKGKTISFVETDF